jgi:hypothetical protein
MSTPFIIDGKKVSEYYFRCVVDRIDDLLLQVHNYGGYVFGGYLRDFIIPNLEREITDIDLWFKTKEDFNRFINNDSKLRFVGTTTNFELYNAPIKHYELVVYNTLLVHVSIIISPTLPVNDFDVNCLTKQYYCYYNGDIDPCNYSLPSNISLLTQIKNKEMNMLPSYLEHLTGKYGEYHLQRVENFIKKGWTVKLYGFKVSNKEELVRYLKNNMPHLFKYQLRDAYLKSRDKKILIQCVKQYNLIDDEFINSILSSSYYVKLLVEKLNNL